VPPRLLIVSFSVCPAPDRHGVGLLNVIKALASRYAVDVLTLRAGELPFVERFMKTRMLRVPIGVGSLGEKVEAFRRAIRRQLEGEDYDLVHLRSAWGARAVLAGVQAPTRVVYEVARSTEGEPRAADEQLAEALADEESQCLERADLIVVPTGTGRTHLLDRGVELERVVVVPPGVDVDHFDWEAESAGDGVPRVLYAGRIGGGRGMRLLAAAVGQVRRRRPLKLVLAGAIEESWQPILDEALARADLVPDDVEQLGAIEHDDIPRLIAQASVCVAPATPANRPLAGFPTKLLEYMACRRAVVAPRQPAVQELVEDGQDGLLFEPGDVEDLAQAIARLLDNPALREALAESGYRRVRQDFPASATRRRLLEGYTRLMPASTWAPPNRTDSPLDALPAHPDTTARRASPSDSTPTLPLALAPRPVEIVIEAPNFEEAGEDYHATIEPFGASDVVVEAQAARRGPLRPRRTS
jgi:glycosyltransferase involved in cell wall biosynthesis